MAKAKNKGGRPSKYTQLNIEKVKALAERGWTDREMSEFFDVSYATWNNWKKAHPKFLDSLKEWKTHADVRVERSLYERAIGYAHEDTKFATHEGVITDQVQYVKHYAPDTTAIIYWLKNRMPEQYRDKVEMEHTGSGGGPMVIRTNALRDDE